MADGKVAVVTGSSSGIGLLTAVELALSGYRVVATMRNMGSSSRLEEAAQKAGIRDRLDLRPYGTACSERGWPCFETSCLRDTASPSRAARTVRIVSTDRLVTR